MGNSSSSSASHQVSKLNNVETESLHFHHVHSTNVKLFHNGRLAKRVESFCKGICFSDRPVLVEEKIRLRVSEVSTNWSGFLRVGFTSINPATRKPETLPRYACPDMTNTPGNWAKALPERYCLSNAVITYYVTRNGDMFINVNGQSLPGVFFSGVNTNSPLWALIDIYGNATGVEFLPLQMPVLTRSVSLPAPQQQSSSSLTPSVNRISHTSRIAESSPVKYHTRNLFIPLTFNTRMGKSVRLNSERTVATRLPHEYSSAYVFTQRPLKLTEKVVIQILTLDFTFSGGLTVGVTSCNPADLRQHELPDDADALLDRPEYWVVHKDVFTGGEPGDELSFTLTNEGEVHFGKNGQHVAVIMHVDKTIPLWLFLDLYGQFSQVKLLGIVGKAKVPTSKSSTGARALPLRAMSVCTDSPPSNLTVALPPSASLGADAPPVPPRLAKSFSIAGTTTSARSTTPLASSTMEEDLLCFDLGAAAASSHQQEANDNMSNECTVCFEKPCDSVIYKCGHVCMCYECALSVKSSADALCPICRQDIQDIIRIFKT